MTAIMSPGSTPATSPPAIASPAPVNTAHPALPPIITSPPARRTTMPRPMSHASKNRLSQYSTTGSIPPRSRPVSHVFPVFTSSLPYTLVRDFAYPSLHPLHYGPPPEPSRPPSGMTTPASEQRRLSDPPTAWDSKTSWDSWSGGGSHRPADLPSIQFADGPPWSEDEDLQSPVVSSRHRKHKTSSGGAYGRSRSAREASSADNYDGERGYYVGTSGDGSERYYINQGDEANGPGGEYVTYPPGQGRHNNNNSSNNNNSTSSNNNNYQLASQQPRGYADPQPYDSDDSSACSSPGYHNVDQSRYSRDYQFTITSPDEEMHGKAVALFDFERENENELPLVEGQIIWVSYRHSQGWLVAEDPKTQESGLVPEEYVRLLRDIEGGMTSLTAQLADLPPGSPGDVGTPTQAEHMLFGSSASAGGQIGYSPSGTASVGTGGSGLGHGAGGSTTLGGGSSTGGGPGSVSSVGGSSTNGYHEPIVSTFSTSSKDLDPYPQHLLGTQAGQPPPQVVHYHGQRGGSQANTPTLLFHHDIGGMRRGSLDTNVTLSGNGLSRTRSAQPTSGEAQLETLPDAKMEGR